MVLRFLYLEKATVLQMSGINIFLPFNILLLMFQEECEVVRIVYESF